MDVAAAVVGPIGAFEMRLTGFEPATGEVAILDPDLPHPGRWWFYSAFEYLAARVLLGRAPCEGAPMLLKEAYRRLGRALGVPPTGAEERARWVAEKAREVLA